MPADPYAIAQMNQTAASFAKLAALRGISSEISVSENGEYLAKIALSDAAPANCGPSVHGLYEWLDAQPGVQP